ncbi:papilin [Bactrocera oleae]|uniref:papilin n=1 Tax=Bactrocera oleae TaxID=104688 RepID=UPI00387EB161
MALHFQRCLRVLLLLIAVISAVSSAPQQKQTAQKQAVVSGPAGGGQARVQDPKCQQPKEPGPCRMNLDRYYYNSQTNACELFKFGGCRGNDNKFGFLKTCEDACVIAKTTTNSAAPGNAKAPAPAPAAVPAVAPDAVPKNPKPVAIPTNTNAKKTPIAAQAK